MLCAQTFSCALRSALGAFLIVFWAAMQLPPPDCQSKIRSQINVSVDTFNHTERRAPPARGAPDYACPGTAGRFIMTLLTALELFSCLGLLPSS